jgi:dolichol-phosphate mannosyltransferase
MTAATRVLVFTATYDERETIEHWVRGVAVRCPEADMLVVDDSSPDGTALLLEELRREFPQLRVHVRAGKEGLNTAHLYALEYGLDQGYDRVVTMDADGSHQPKQIPELLRAADAAEFSIGTRYRGGSHQAALMRRVLSRGANTLARTLLPMGLSEYTTSFRVFTPPALQVVTTADFHFRGYAFFIECLEVMHRAGVTIAEVPIDFLDRTGGVSKIPRAQILLSVEALGQLAWQRRSARSRSASQ